VHLALEELQAHDGVDGDHEQDQQGDVEQRQQGLQDGVHHHLKAFGGEGNHVSPPQRDLHERLSCNS